jgi:hypothetical protein
MKRAIYISAGWIVGFSIWQSTTNAGSFEQIRAITCAPSRADIGAVVDGGVVRVTRDGSKTWTYLGKPPDSSHLNDAENILIEDEATDDSIEPEALDDTVEGDDSLSEVVKSVQDESNPDSSTPPIIAVDDEGTVAWSDRLSIAVTAGGSKAWRFIFHGSIKALAFDTGSVLFALTDAGIVCFESMKDGMRPLQYIRTIRPVSLFRGQKGSVGLLTQFGVYSIERLSGHFQLQEQLRITGGTAAAFLSKTADGEQYLIASRGRILKMKVHGRAVTEFAFPEPVDLLFVNKSGDIRYRSQSGQWRSKTNDSAVLLPITHSTQDAEGRYWVAGPAGLSVSSDSGSKNAPMIMSRLDLREPPSSNVLPSIPHPPRCRPFAISPLPIIDLSFSSDRGRALSADSESLNLSYGVFFGTMFTWRIGVENIDSCRARHEQYQVEQLRLIRKNADLKNLWQRENRRASTMSTLKEALEAELSVEKIEALLGISDE